MANIGQESVIDRIGMSNIWLNVMLAVFMAQGPKYRQ
jgi:hypothetical protein